MTLAFMGSAILAILAMLIGMLKSEHETSMRVMGCAIVFALWHLAEI